MWLCTLEVIKAALTASQSTVFCCNSRRAARSSSRCLSTVSLSRVNTFTSSSSNSAKKLRKSLQSKQAQTTPLLLLGWHSPLLRERCSIQDGKNSQNGNCSFCLRHVQCDLESDALSTEKQAKPKLNSLKIVTRMCITSNFTFTGERRSVPVGLTADSNKNTLQCGHAPSWEVGTPPVAVH